MIAACRTRRREAHVRRGALLRAQVRPAQAAGRRGRARHGPPGQAVREARRPARAAGSGTSTRCGGGVTMDMGCHAIEFFRWMLGKADGQGRIASVYADMGTHVHGDKTRGDDDAHPDRGVRGRRRRPGRGVLDQAGRHGRPRRGLRLRGRGVRRPAPRQRAARPTRASGYGYAVEKAGTTRAGPHRSTRSPGTTASRRRWSTSSTASATGRPPRETAGTAAPWSRRSTRCMPRRVVDAGSTCRSPAMPPGRSTTGSRPGLEDQRPPDSHRRCARSKAARASTCRSLSSS